MDRELYCAGCFPCRGTGIDRLQRPCHHCKGKGEVPYSAVARDFYKAEAEEAQRWKKIIVNDKEKIHTAGAFISYEQVVSKANLSCEILYRIAYSNGPHQNEKGLMSRSDKLKVIDGMKFNVEI